jgi:hypothetical protein
MMIHIAAVINAETATVLGVDQVKEVFIRLCNLR